MKITYVNGHCVDCTSDPHEVNYPELETALTDIMEVCKNPILFGILSVNLYEDYDADIVWESDDYSDWVSDHETDPKRKTKASGKYAEKNKVAGLYFYDDNKKTEAAGRKLPVGLMGVEKAIRMILKEPERFERLSIGVMWKFSMNHSCSDYITLHIREEPVTVDYSNQDWYRDMDTYPAHCEALTEIISCGVIHPYVS